MYIYIFIIFRHTQFFASIVYCIVIEFLKTRWTYNFHIKREPNRTYCLLLCNITTYVIYGCLKFKIIIGILYESAEYSIFAYTTDIIFSNEIVFSTCVQSGMLLDMAKLFEPALAVGTLVRLLTGMDANVLDQLMVGAERLETLLALMWFAHF